MTTKAARTKVATPWGRAAVADEVELEQEAGERRFGVLVQLLEGEGGEALVRIAYTTGGSARRGPVTLRQRDLATLRRRLRARPELARLLGCEGGDAATR